MPRLFAFGLGYCARALIRDLKAQETLTPGFSAHGTTRSQAMAQAFEPLHAGVTILDGADDAARLVEGLSGTSHLLISAPPGEAGDPLLNLFQEDLKAVCGALQWVGYLSTTGVYGDHGGAWVTEETPLDPRSARAERRVEAERQWLDWGAHNFVPVTLFRLAGIYGPGRSQIDSLKAGTARRIVKPSQIFSRIHVDDVALILMASIMRGGPGDIFNVCDDEPAPPHEVVAYASALLGIEPPPLEEFETAQASMSEMARSFYGESKRVSNAKVKEKLGVTLRYPNYRDGLRASLPRH